MIHAAKTGRFSPWGYIILMLPGVGAAAYVVAELIPEWLGTYQGQKAQQRLGRALNPERKYRALADELHIADTIANRATLAAECLVLEKFGEAKAHYEEILARLHGDEPIYRVGKARAEFGLGEYAQAVATLDDLRVRFPEYESGEGHLLYACALEEGGRTAAAVTEFEALSQYYAGAEPRVRYGLLLRNSVAKKRGGRYWRTCSSDWPAFSNMFVRCKRSGSRWRRKLCAGKKLSLCQCSSNGLRYINYWRYPVSKTATIRARVEPKLKKDAEAVLKSVGLTSSEAITLFLTQIKLTKGLPFAIRVPNKETRRAFHEARSRKNIENFDSILAWKKKMRIQ
jgi:addiction module RelB/DinJ family antitoxin